jgi:hypothetical protein
MLGTPKLVFLTPKLFIEIGNCYFSVWIIDFGVPNTVIGV